MEKEGERDRGWERGGGWVGDGGGMARNASHFAANWPTSRSNEFRQKKSKKKMAQANTRLSSLELEEPRSPSSRTII